MRDKTDPANSSGLVFHFGAPNGIKNTYKCGKYRQAHRKLDFQQDHKLDLPAVEL